MTHADSNRVLTVLVHEHIGIFIPMEILQVILFCENPKKLIATYGKLGSN